MKVGEIWFSEQYGEVEILEILKKGQFFIDFKNSYNAYGTNFKNKIDCVIIFKYKTHNNQSDNCMIRKLFIHLFHKKYEETYV